MGLKELIADDLEAWNKQHDPAIAKILEPLKRPAFNEVEYNKLSPEQKREIDKIHEFHETSFACFKEAILRAGFFAKHFREGADDYKIFRDKYDVFKPQLRGHATLIRKSYKLIDKINQFIVSKLRKKHFDHIEFSHAQLFFPTGSNVTIDNLISAFLNIKEFINKYQEQFKQFVEEERSGFKQTTQHQNDISSLVKNISSIIDVVIDNHEFFEHAFREFNIRVARRKSLIRIREKNIPSLERLYNADYMQHFRTQNFIGDPEEAKKLEIAKRQKYISRVLKIPEGGFSIKNAKKIVSEKIDSIWILPEISVSEGLNDIEASFMCIRHILNIYETALTGFDSKEIISYEPENIRYGNMRYLNRMLSRSKDNAVLDKVQMLIYGLKFYLQCWQSHMPPRSQFFGNFPDVNSCSSYQNKLDETEIGLLKNIGNHSNRKDLKIIVDIIEAFECEFINEMSFTEGDVKYKLKDISFEKYQITLSRWPLDEKWQKEKNT